jgi:uncharacterized DUF497 family protein
MIEFDPNKAALNLLKHGIAFADVEPVLFDERGFTSNCVRATRHGPEIRHVTTGMDALGRLITVVWTKRGRAVRLISARAARSDERKHYEQR